MTFLGPHLSTAKGYAATVHEAVKIGANAFQIFSRNPRGSSFREIKPEDIVEFRALLSAHHFGAIQAHAPYTMNLASADERVYAFGCQVLREDTARMEELGAELFVLHPGSHLGAGVSAGIARIADALGGARAVRMTVLLETMSGRGSEVGFRFEQLREIIDRAEGGARLGVCMDLCHVYAAGYDVKSDLDGVLVEFDKTIGLSRLKSIHLNDSLCPLGSQVDRHAPIGAGEMGFSTAIHALKHPALRDVPFYLETPLDSEEHRREIELLRSHLST